MKNNIAILFIFATIVCFGQKPPKIDFDDDIITLDKIKKYDFVVTKKGGFTALESSQITNLEGAVLLIVKDTTLYLDQLENELEQKREFVDAHIFIAPQLNKIAFVEPINMTKARGKIFSYLKDTNFFTTEGQDSMWFNQMVQQFGGHRMVKVLEEFSVINERRKINAQKTREMFGPLTERKPAAIQISSARGFALHDGAKKLALVIKDTKRSGPYSTTYNIINNENKVIGHFYYQPSEFTGNVLTNADGVRKNYKFSRMASFDDILTTINEYLIYYGYL